MILTDLPPEILLLILKFLPPASFTITVTTCQTIRAIALQNRRLLLFKLWRIPGIKQGLEDLTNPELLTLFRRRAANNLLGLGSLHDRHIYSFDPSVISSIDASKSAITTKSSPNAALVCRNCPLVHLFDIEGTVLIPKGVVDALGASDHARQPYEILKVAHNDFGGISILHRPVKMGERRPNSPDKFLHITHLYTRWARSWRTEWALIETPEETDDEFRSHLDYEFSAVSMAVVRPGIVAISWKPDDPGGAGQVWIYTIKMTAEKMAMQPKNSQENEGLLYESYKVYDTSEPTTRRYRQHDGHREGLRDSVKSIEIDPPVFEGSKRLCFKIANPGQPVQQGYRIVSIPSGSRKGRGDLRPTRSFREYCTEVDIGSVTVPDERRFAVARPFFGHHVHGDQGATCHHDYLALGVALDDDVSAYILTATRRTWACRAEVDLDTPDRNGEWRATARLVGYRRPDTNLNGIVAYAPGHTRIAIANWTDIYIWPFETRQLCGELYDGGYYPRRRAQECYSLYPAVIPVGFVVHQLTFVEENSLWALTSNGLMLFEIGPRCNKVVRTSVLEMGVVEQEVDGAPGYWV